MDLPREDTDAVSSIDTVSRHAKRAKGTVERLRSEERVTFAVTEVRDFFDERGKRRRGHWSKKNELEKARTRLSRTPPPVLSERERIW